jgi:hypothetical protein
MAEFSFEEASTPTLNKPTSFSFEDAIDSGGNKSTTPTVEGKSGAAFGMYPKPKMGPGTDATGLSAFASSAIEGALATPGVLLGARAGSAIMPPVAPFVGPLSKPIGGIVGGIGGGILANLGISSLEKFADSVFGTNIAQVREEEQQQYPYTSLFGQVAGGSLNPWMRPSIPSTFKQAAFGGGVMGVVGAGQRAVTGGDTFDPIAVGVDVVSGAFTTPTKRGLRLLGHTPVINNNKPFDIPETPLGTATPEEKTAYIDKLKAIKAERDAKAALVEAEEPAPPPVEEGLKTREEHKTAINNLEEDIYLKLEIDRQVAENTGDVEGLKLVEEQIKINQDKLQQLRKDIPAVEFKNPEQPTWEELHDHLWNSRSVGEAFDTLLSGPRIGGKGQRLLIRALNQSEFIRSASLSFSKEPLKYIDKNGVEQNDAAGLYKADENIHSVELGKDGDLAALLHESIHAGTYRLLAEGNSPAALKLKELYQEFLDRHNAEYDIALEKFQKENIAPTIGELKAFEKTHRKQYGLNNVEEFIAEAFTSGNFQRLLASFKSKEPGGNVIGNMWSAFKNVVREGLNVPASERTAFDDAIEHGVKLIEESSGFKVEGDTTTTIPSKASDKFAQEEEKTFWNKVQEVRTNKLAAEQEAQKTYEVYQKTPTALTHHLYKKAEKDLRTAATAYYEYIPMEERLPSDFNDEVAVKQYQDSVNKRLEFLEREQAFKQSQTALDKTSNKTLPSKTVSLPSKLSQEIHDQLEREGIAVAHTSPHKFGEFNWVKHHLSGEGNMSKGAGTYMSQGDKTNQFYVDMAKEKVVEKHLKSPEGKADKTRIDPLEQEMILANKKYDNLIDSLLDNRRFKSNLHAQLFKPEYSLQKQEIERKILEQKTKITQLEKEIYVAKKEVSEKESAFNLEKEQIKQKLKIPTYHSTIEAKPEEFLDWNSKKQSDLVKNAFKNLGIDASSLEDHLKFLSKEQIQSLDVTDLNKWSGKFEEDGEIKIRVKNPEEGSYSTYTIKVNEATYDANGNFKVNEYLVLHDRTAHAEVTPSLQEAIKSVQQTVHEDFFGGYTVYKTGEDLYRQLANKFEPQGRLRGNLTDWDAQLLGDVKASIALAEQGVVGNVHDASGGREKQSRNYVVFNDSRIKQNLVTLASKIKESISEPAAEAAEKIDPRSIPNEEAFYKHATNIYETYGEAAAIKFLEDYNTNLKERSIPIPETLDQFDDSLHKFRTFESKDKSENVVNFRENVKNGVTEEDRAKWFDMRERGEELPPEGKAILDGIDSENVALIRKIKALGGDVGDEFATGQSRTRVFGDVDSNWKDAIKKLFANEGGFSNNIAEQANAARDRTVFGTNDGRIIELHRQPEDVVIPGKKTIKKGTEIFEWKDDKRKLIGRSDNLELKRGDTFELSKLGDALTDGVGGTSVRRTGKFELTIVDAKVPDIEASAPYRYLHDAEVSARLANIGLRKMARELEFIQNLKQSKLFETIGFSPDKPLKDLPKGWIVPSNIDRVPELRGWHFDPKAAAIISDFAKVWDNDLWMKLTNQLVKNMMLNPVPHMFNEVMHLWNARGFSGWVDPRKLGSFAITARQAWRDVGNQTKFYRDIMREGGSILGADPRNDLFDKIIMDAGKNILKDPELSRSVSLLAKKLGTSVLDLYNGVSKASTKAMWFTRDVMYVQYIREIMNRHEKRTGDRMELSDAIVEAERHMPNYRMPSEVLGSRGVAWTLKNPNLSMFSRYHYGMVKSLVNTLKDVNPKNLTSPEGRVHFREGIDSMLAIGVATAVVYPLMDEMAQALFGEGAEQRRAGPYHLLHAAEQVIGGKKDATALIWPVFTFNPVLLSLGQLLFNVNIFNKKELFHPDDDIEDILSDVGIYTVKQIPQVPPVMSAVSEEGGETQFIAKQLDIKAKTEKQLEQEEKAKAYQARSKKNRDTKREKNIYKP